MQIAYVSSTGASHQDDLTHDPVEDLVMPDGQGRETSLRRLREGLRRLREEQGLQQAEVVEKLDWSSSKLIRIENGSVGISVTDLRALAAVYRAPEPLVDELVA